jgi:PAS domain S-box-containing protein
MWAHLPLEPGRVTRMPAAAIAAPITREQNTTRTIERIILEEYAPASVIINDQAEVLYFSGKTSPYLEAPAGAPTNKLLSLARRNIRLELRTALHRAIENREEVTRENVVFKNGKRPERINIIVRPLFELGKEAGLYMVLFEEVTVTTAPARMMEKAIMVSEHPMIQQLESELRTTREDLQTTIEELETSNEELKSANEELLSMNEELQSTNEELQTSKEELQSLNEELQKKVEELDGAHSDTHNLFESTQIATLFLDNEGRIKRFTPAVTQLVPLKEEHIGRPFGDFLPAFPHRELVREIQRVIRNSSAVERVLEWPGDKRSFLLRISPYRTLEETVHGVVLTFTNVTELRQAQAERSQLAAIVEGSKDAIIGISLEHTIITWNPGAETLYGYAARDMVGKPIWTMVPKSKRPELQHLFESVLKGYVPRSIETLRLRKDGKELEVSLSISGIYNSEGNNVVGFSAISRDISERKQTERSLRQKNERLILLSEAAQHLLQTIDPVKLAAGVFKQIVPAIEVDTFCCGIPDGPSGRIKVEFWGETTQSKTGLPKKKLIAEEFCNRVAIHRKPFTAFDLANSTRTDLQPLRRLGYTSYLCIPLLIRGELLGCVCFGSRTKARFAADELEFIETICRYLALARERAENEQELRQFRSRLELALRSSGAVIWDHDLKTHQIRTYGLSQDLFGSEVLDYKKFMKVVHPDDLPVLEQAGKMARQGKPTPLIEYRYRRNGEIRWMMDRATPIPDSEGNITRVGGVCVDITPRKQAELALRFLSDAGAILAQSLDYKVMLSEFCNLMVKEPADVCFVDLLTEENTLRRTSWAARQALLKKRGEQLMTGRTFDRSHPLFGAMHKCRTVSVRNPRASFLQRLGLGKDFFSTQRQVRVDHILVVPIVSHGVIIGSYTLVRLGPRDEEFSLHESTLFQEIGRRLGVSVDNARLHQAVLESETRFRQLADAMPQIVWASRPSGEIDYVNRRWFEITDMSVSSYNEALTRLIHPEDSKKSMDIYQQSIEAGTPYELEYRLRNPQTQEYRWHLARSIPVRNEQGQVVRWYGTSTDIHELKCIHQELNDTQRKLTRHTQELEKLVLERTANLRETVDSLEGVCYTIAHDLRGPLRAIQGFTQILMSEYGKSFGETGRELGQRVVNAATRMDRLIKDLLDFARISHVEMPREKIDLDRELKLVLDQFSEEISSRRAVIKIKRPLPSVMANPTIIQQILTNLISNALKFVKKGERPNIDIRSQLHGDFVRLYVRDNGIGIEAEHRQEIFGLFNRLHPNENYSGTGVGLAIVKKGIERIGGSVKIVPIKGRGTCFLLEMPAAKNERRRK